MISSHNWDAKSQLMDVLDKSDKKKNKKKKNVHCLALESANGCLISAVLPQNTEIFVDEIWHCYGQPHVPAQNLSLQKYAIVRPIGVLLWRGLFTSGIKSAYDIETSGWMELSQGAGTACANIIKFTKTNKSQLIHHSNKPRGRNLSDTYQMNIPEKKNSLT